LIPLHQTWLQKRTAWYVKLPQQLSLANKNELNYPETKVGKKRDFKESHTVPVLNS